MTDKPKAVAIVTLDGAEMAVLILENYHNMTRPAGQTAQAALEALRLESPEEVDGAIRASKAIAFYFNACLQKLDRVQ